MILLYGGGGEPGAGEIPMDLFRKQASNEKYVLPENVTVTVHEGKTVVAKFYNELKPVIPDVPKTGDTTNMPLWAALAGISLLGAGVAAFFTFRKKKEVGKHER